MPPDGPSLLDRVRAQTRPLHEHIESQVPILRDEAGPATYRRYLAALLGFHRPVEAALARVRDLDRLPLGLAQRWKAPHLEADLLALGLSRDEVRMVPAARIVPSLDGIPAALGCMYVLEGATLGAQVIYRELDARVPDLMARASRYLRRYDGQTGARWKEFCTVLTATRAGDADAVVAAAVATFRAFSRWLDACDAGAAPGAAS